MLDQVRRHADQFDIIHFHVDLLQHVLFQDMADKCITTLHGRLDLPDYHPIYRAFPHMPLVSISKSQRRPMPCNVNWLATIPHGLPLTKIPFHPRGGDYLAFLGRIAPEKRPDRAIEIAKRAGMRLKIAAKIDAVDRRYFEETIEPLLKGSSVEFIGEIADAEKSDFLGNALALLFPIDWPEPFGLVMIEALSAGTPVIAWRNGSVPEVIADGVSGVIVESIEEAVAAVRTIGSLDREGVRREFETRFTATRMAQDYVSAYQDLLTNPRSKLPSAVDQAA
jgi:glycosyltransferase involved in cell wall biosynthesis